MVITDSNYNEFISCPECNGNIISTHERGEIACSQCGLIVKEKLLDLSHSGIRAFSKTDKNKKSRTGDPITILTPDITLCTIIEKNKIKDPDLRRAASRDSHLTWEARNMLIATTELKRIGHNLNLPEYVKKAAMKLYKMTYRANILRGRSIIGMVTACLVFACKKFKIPRSLKDISKESSLEEEKIRNFYKTLIKKLNLKSPLTDPISLIPKYVAELGLSPEIERITTCLLKRYLEEKVMNSVNPKGLCAGMIYLISKIKNQKISQKTIAKVIGVTEVTIRSRYKDIIEKIDLFSNLFV